MGLPGRRDARPRAHPGPRRLHHPRHRYGRIRACRTCELAMIAKTLFFAKTSRPIRREIYVRQKVFAIMSGALVGYFARRATISVAAGRGPSPGVGGRRR